MAEVHAGKLPRGIFRTDSGMEYDILGGWHEARPYGWWDNANTIKKRKQVYDGQGNKHWTYTYDIPVSLVGHSAHDENNAQRQELLALANDAFNTDRKDHGATFDVEGCGHIKRLEYAFNEAILRVTFSNGAICVYDGVPEWVAGTLRHWAIEKTLASPNYYKRGRYKVDRHKLGVEFWKLIRLPHRQTGAKFPFEYVSHGTGTIVRSNGRHIMRFNDGHDYMSVLNDEEFAAYVELMKTVQDLHRLNFKEPISKESTYTHTEDESGGADAVDSQGKKLDSLENLANEVSTDDADFLRERQKVLSSIQDRVSNSALQKLLNTVQNELTNLLKQADETGMHGDLLNNQKDRAAYVKAWQDVYPELKMLNIRQDINDKATLKNINHMRDIGRYEDALRKYDKDGVLMGYNKNDKSVNHPRRVWTKQELIDFANPWVPGNIDKEHAITYKKYIDREDYQGALDYLKSLSRPIEYQDSKSGSKKKEIGKSYKPPKYAGRLDVYKED